MDAQKNISDRLYALTFEQLDHYLWQMGEVKAEASAGDIRFFREPYQDAARIFHDDDHRYRLGKPELSDGCEAQLKRLRPDKAKAISAVAGQGHDLVYLNVGPVHSQVKDKLAEWVDWQQWDADKALPLTEAGEKSDIVTLVADLFAQPLYAPIAKGKNEFLSALATAKFLDDKAVPKAFIAAVTVAIAGTIPFQSSSLTDEYSHDGGYFEALAERLRSTELFHGDEELMDDIMTVAVDLANRDIYTFYGDWKEMVRLGYELHWEFNPTLASGDAVTMEKMMEVVKTDGLYRMIRDGKLAAEDVVHRYNNYPSEERYQEMVAQVKANVAKAITYYDRKQAGTAVAVAIATAIGEQQTKVTDFIGGEKWQGMNSKIHDDPAEDYSVLYAVGDDPQARAIGNAPIAARIYQAGGEQAIQKIQFSSRKRGGFVDAQDAKSHLSKLSLVTGHEAMGDIITMLAEVARDKGKSERAEKLTALSNEVCVNPHRVSWR